MAAHSPVTVRSGSISKLRILLLDKKAADPNFYERDVAVACGFHPTRLSEYATGKRAIPVHHLQLLCSYFNCRPYDILGEAGDVYVGK